PRMDAEPRKPRPDMLGRSEGPLHAGYGPAHRIADPGGPRQKAENRRVGNVVPNEQRCPPGKRGMGHQLTNCRSFAEETGLDLDHRLAEQDLDIAWIRRCDGGNFPLEKVLLLGGQAVVEGNRMRFVLDEHQWVYFGEQMKLIAHGLAECPRALFQVRAFGGEPYLGAVAADGRSAQRREQLVDSLDGPSADKRNAAF